jgi:hypothetical protein
MAVATFLEVTWWSSKSRRMNTGCQHAARVKVIESVQPAA